MWCDNCGLIFPLRGGGTLWNLLIVGYSIAGAVIMFVWGPFIYFVYPEWIIYGVIALAVMAVAGMAVIGMAARSYMFTRMAFMIWPIVLVAVAVRGGLMIFQLQRNKDEFNWECNNGYALWPPSAEKDYGQPGVSMPKQLCDFGYHRFYTAMCISVIVDLLVQIYGWFLAWRFKASIECAYRLVQNDKGFY